MIDELRLLPPPKQKVAANVLFKLGFSYRQISSIIDISKSSVERYSKEEIPPELGQFGTELEEAFLGYETVLAAKAASRIDEMLPRARINEALAVYKTMRRLERPITNVNNVIANQRFRNFEEVRAEQQAKYNGI